MEVGNRALPNKGRIENPSNKGVQLNGGNESLEGVRGEAIAGMLAGKQWEYRLQGLGSAYVMNWPIKKPVSRNPIISPVHKQTVEFEQSGDFAHTVFQIDLAPHAPYAWDRSPLKRDFYGDEKK